MYVIREMIQNDWEAVRKIYQDGINSNIATFETKCPSHDEFIETHLDGYSFVITDSRKILGWVALKPTSNREVYRGVSEVSIYVDKMYTHIGLGMKLMTHIINLSENNGIWTLQSGIFEDNIASIKLHKKCGF